MHYFFIAVSFSQFSHNIFSYYWDIKIIITEVNSSFAIYEIVIASYKDTGRSINILEPVELRLFVSCNFYLFGKSTIYNQPASANSYNHASLL
jgi:hypothetical protein